MSSDDLQDEVERAHDLYRRGAYQAAAPRYERLALDGSVEAQLILGGMYQYGLGVEKNLNTAQAWYRRADGLGSLVGAYYLGTVLRIQGQYREAREAFERAATEGYAPALYRLGKMHMLGQGVLRNRQKGYEYIEQAARRGHLFAERDVAWRSVLGQRGFRRIPEGIRRYFAAARAAASLVRSNPHDDRVR